MPIYHQAQLTPSAEIAQGVKDLSQGQLRREFGHVLNASTGGEGYDVKDVVNDGVIRFHVVAELFTGSAPRENVEEHSKDLVLDLTF